MAERVKGRRVTEYQYNELEQLVGEVEIMFEAVVVEAAPEFVGVTQTQSLPHGQRPLEAGDWSIYNIYEKGCIWMLKVESKLA